MIQVSFRKKDEKLFGFTCVGHAEYARRDKDDIVCAAVSALVITTLNSLEALAKEQFVRAEVEEGYTYCEVRTPISPEGELLLQSLQLGLKEIESRYGSRFVHVTIGN